MKVSSDDIRSIKPGTSVTFTVPHPKDVNNARSLASRLNSCEPERKVRYSCKSNYKRRQVTITATPVR